MSKKHTAKKRKHFKKKTNSLLFEISWEVCNQVGGIYTVIRSKVPSVINTWGDNYCLLGPYIPGTDVDTMFDPILDSSTPLGQVVKSMQDEGLKVYYGHWLVTGRPKVILFDLTSIKPQIDVIKHELYQHFGIETKVNDHLFDGVLCFGKLVEIFFTTLLKQKTTKKKIFAHFHEWLSAASLPEIRLKKLDIVTIFTTHATVLGRYLAMNVPSYYEKIHCFDWVLESKHFDIEPQVKIEREITKQAHLFTTVSNVTARECIHLLGRTPDHILPNGLNIERFEALHEFQNYHKEYKEKIHLFTMAHFFKKYSFPLDNTLYFFTSGRYEYKNKGLDVLLAALTKLNKILKQEGIATTVVTFIITKKPFRSILPSVLESIALRDEIKFTISQIQNQIGERLFSNSTSFDDNKLPSLNQYVDDYWKLRFRRSLQSFKKDTLPAVVTHELVDDSNDEVLRDIRRFDLINKKEDKVKVVYHPDFLSSSNPVFGMEYSQFVRGCHLGIFPSFYEPWGYTPLECLASGIPALTTDFAGFGNFSSKYLQKKGYKNGLYIISRQNRTFDEIVDDLVSELFEFVKMDRRARISQRNKVEASSALFSWKNLISFYEEVYSMANELE